jgi:hypothetical protein
MFWNYLFFIHSSTGHLTCPILLRLMILIPIISSLTMHSSCLPSCLWKSIVSFENILSYGMVGNQFVLFSFFYKRRELTSFFLLEVLHVYVRQFLRYFNVFLDTLFCSSKVAKFRINKRIFTFV